MGVSDAQWRNSYGPRVSAHAGTRTKWAPSQKVKKRGWGKEKEKKEEKRR